MERTHFAGFEEEIVAGVGRVLERNEARLVGAFGTERGAFGDVAEVGMESVTISQTNISVIYNPCKLTKKRKKVLTYYYWVSKKTRYFSWPV